MESQNGTEPRYVEWGNRQWLVDPSAVDRFLARLDERHLVYELREHEPPRHARHLAALWHAPLHQAGRATLFCADGQSVLAVVAADRKVSAPLFRSVQQVVEVRVLRADRGVGRLGWTGMGGEPGALPAVPELFGARGVVDHTVAAERVILSLGGTRSIALRRADYAAAVGAAVLRFTGATRLLPAGGMVIDPAPED